jgi:O-acetylhomoserine (thiol)-lyase
MPVQSIYPETLVLHAGPRSDATTSAVAMPICQTSYQLRSAAQAAEPLALGDVGNFCSGIVNPACDALEQKMAALEGGVAALAVSSGQAASAMAVQNLCRPGDNIVSSTDLHGGTWSLFANTLPSMGISVRFVDPEDLDGFRRASDSRTRAYYAETLPSPKLTVFPIGEVAAIGRALGVPLIVDNTAAPILCRPLQHGAAIVVHSATKCTGGHSASIGGMIVDGGNFDWASHARRFPTLCEHDASYHGAVWAEAARPLGPTAYIARARVVLLRDIGSAMSSFNAFQLIQSLETLPLRMRAHCRNAADVALHLQRHAAVARVIYAGMHENAMQHRRAATYLKGGFGGLVGLELRAGREAAARFIDALGMFRSAASIGDARSLAIHPASTTHSQLNPADQLASGVTPGYVRLSVGIEHIDDIIADLDQALAVAVMPATRSAA